MKSSFPLVNLMEPLNDDLHVSHMKTMPIHSTLSDIQQISLSTDILLQDKEGTAVGWIPISRLVYKLLELYKENRAYLEALLTNVEDAITIIDRTGTVTNWNEKSEQLYNIPKQEIIDKPITHFFNKESLLLLSTIQQEEQFIQQYHQPHPQVHVLINSSTVLVDNEIIGGISVERNISDIVKLNQHIYSTTAYLHDLEQSIQAESNIGFNKIKGRSKALQDAIGLAEKVAETDAPVFITGESGVGKELFAEGIHTASKRSKKPFLALNCGAIPNSLFESELFGYEQGAFTGALKGGKKGKFDLAKGGTLFLDEIGEMPLDLQVKLLRVLQEKKYDRVGGTASIDFDVRIIAATNQNLEEMIEKGTFREDLFYRLNVISIHVPPLRHRREDIPTLVQFFLKEFSIKYGSKVPEMEAEVLYTFLQHPWQGNIRQLQNIIERLVILTRGLESITVKHLPDAFLNQLNHPPVSTHETVMPQNNTETEKQSILNALNKTYGNRTAAAKLLGISRANLYNKLKKYNL
ncbi:transcriptional regulator [Bacillus sp. TS-2]|nr:transcriptional regulator [Bacillus sp. TS-2]